MTQYIALQDFEFNALGISVKRGVVFETPANIQGLIRRGLVALFRELPAPVVPEIPEDPCMNTCIKKELAESPVYHNGKPKVDLDDLAENLDIQKPDSNKTLAKYMPAAVAEASKETAEAKVIEAAKVLAAQDSREAHQIEMSNKMTDLTEAVEQIKPKRTKSPRRKGGSNGQNTK